MNTINQLKALFVLLSLCICPTAFAKDYIIEMIFFVDTQGAATNSTHISTQPVIPDLQGAIFLNKSALSHGFVRFPREALTLRNYVAALNKSGRYRVLKHIAWLQPGLATEEAIPVRIHAGHNYRDEFKERSFAQADFGDRISPQNHPVNELDGTIKIVLGRYLHVHTDLAYRKPYTVSADALGRDRVLADFAIKTHRKMRSKELHYIDHPLLGILVEIRPAAS